MPAFGDLAAAPTLVCDVDNTILDTRPRVRRCLEAIGRGEVYARTAHSYGGFKDALSPDEVDRFFRLFLSNAHLSLDAPLPGAAEVLHRWAARAPLVYLTGRHDAPGDSMRVGSEAWLKSNGFPLPEGNGVVLWMKPDRFGQDLPYKRDALRQLSAGRRLVAGLGDLPQEGPLYAAFGLLPILVSAVGMFSSKELAATHPDVVIAATWVEVDQLLLRWA